MKPPPCAACRMRSSTGPDAPTCARMPRSIGMYCRSESRALRIGPTLWVSRDWNTTAKRVMPPSTSISKTTSASARPDCGRAVGSLGTRTTTGRRLMASALGASVPRSGQMAFAPWAAGPAPPGFPEPGAPPVGAGVHAEATSAMSASTRSTADPVHPAYLRETPLAGGTGPAAREDVRGGGDDDHADDRGEHRLERAAAAIRRDPGELFEPLHLELLR